jgi:hypothetical protein
MIPRWCYRLGETQTNNSTSAPERRPQATVGVHRQSIRHAISFSKSSKQLLILNVSGFASMSATISREPSVSISN